MAGGQNLFQTLEKTVVKKIRKTKRNWARVEDIQSVVRRRKIALCRGSNSCSDVFQRRSAGVEAGDAPITDKFMRKLPVAFKRADINRRERGRGAFAPTWRDVRRKRWKIPVGKYRQVEEDS